MTLLNYLLILAAVTNSFLAVLVILKDRRNPINRNFAFALISVVCWSVALLLSIFSGNKFATRLITASGMLTAYWFLEFVIVYPNINQRLSKMRSINLITTAFFFVIALIPGTVVKDAHSANGRMTYEPGPFTLPFALTLYFYLIAVVQGD